MRHKMTKSILHALFETHEESYRSRMKKIFGMSCQYGGALNIGYHNNDVVLFGVHPYEGLTLWNCRTGEFIAMRTFGGLQGREKVNETKVSLLEEIYAP